MKQPSVWKLWLSESSVGESQHRSCRVPSSTEQPRSSLFLDKEVEEVAGHGGPNKDSISV